MGRIIIVGATGGIGEALARRIAASGRALHLVARDEARLAALAQDIGASFATADVLDAAGLKGAIEAAPGPVAGLAYCVGTINLKPFARLTEAEFEADFRLNALGAARSIQAALPALKAFEGTASIVLFSTVAARQGFANHASIAMAKGAVEGLVLSLAAELAPKVRVNAIAPSLTKTPLAGKLTASPQMAEAIAQMHPCPAWASRTIRPRWPPSCYRPRPVGSPARSSASMAAARPCGSRADSHGQDGPQGRSRHEDLRGLRQAVRLAQEMGARLGSGEDLLGALQGRPSAQDAQGRGRG